MSHEKSAPPPLTALAAEACDLWQEHLTNLAGDPEAKAELMRLMEPSRQMFADWTKIMQNNLHDAGANPSGFSTTPHPSPASSEREPNEHTFDRSASPRPPASGSASDDSSLRLAQLAHRMGELEKRLLALESGTRPSRGKSPARASRKRG